MANTEDSSKVCSSCKKTLAVTEFYFKAAESRWESICKSCKRLKRRPPIAHRVVDRPVPMPDLDDPREPASNCVEPANIKENQDFAHIVAAFMMLRSWDTNISENSNNN